MKIDVRGLAIVNRELTELANRSKLTAQEERRYALLLSQASLLKTGEVTLQDLMVDETNERLAGSGLPIIKRQAPMSETRAKVEAWQTFINLERQKRTANEAEGNILARIGTYSGLGTFVPTGFIKETYAAMAAHDAFLDENAVSMLNTTSGNPITIPTYGDIENVAVAVGESADTSSSENLISAPGQAVSTVTSYRSPLWRVSIEALQDAEAMGGLINVFKAFAADRISRGAAKDLVIGNGNGKPLGIIPSLLAAGVTPVTAVGSAENTGGSESGVDSIGSKDLAALYLSVNEAYRVSPKAAFFMNDTTRLYLLQLVTKFGKPLIEVRDGVETIYGKPVRISPSMQNIGAGNIPVLFGDGSYWLSRNVIDDNSYVQVVKEATGLAEKGLVALRMFCRWGGSLLYTDANSPAPFGLLQNHT